MEGTQVIINPDREHLNSINLPKKTDSYSPMPYRDVIDMTMEALDKANLKIVEERYIVAKQGKQAQGHYNITSGDNEMQMRLIWHNSYDKTMPLRWAVGGNVIVCSNGVVSGDMGAFKRRHTGTILEEYKEVVAESITKAGDTFKKLQMDRDRMKEIEISKKVRAQLVGQMFIDDAIINSTQLNILAREIQNPSFNYNADNSLWQLYNHTTVALRDSHPRHSIAQHIEVHNFFKKNFKKELSF
jgi:hypothetical protein